MLSSNCAWGSVSYTEPTFSERFAWDLGSQQHAASDNHMKQENTFRTFGNHGKCSSSKLTHASHLREDAVHKGLMCTDQAVSRADTAPSFQRRLSGSPPASSSLGQEESRDKTQGQGEVQGALIRKDTGKVRAQSKSLLKNDRGCRGAK